MTELVRQRIAEGMGVSIPAEGAPAESSESDSTAREAQ
jgi:hypothetical protein